MQSLYPTSPTALLDADLAELYAYPVEGQWVRANFVSTLDGSVQGPDQRSGSLSTVADRRVFALLRSLCDVVLVGAHTTRVEAYLPVREAEVDQQLRRDLGLAPVPPIAVVSRSLDLEPQLVRGGAAPTIVVTTADAPAQALAAVEQVTTVLVAGEHDVDLATALDALAELGLRRVLFEGGPSLLRDLAGSGHLDELCLTVVPRLTAGDPLRLASGAVLDPPAELRLGHLLESDGQLFCRYTRT